MEDLYKILGVEPSASMEELIRRYQFLVISFNPEKFSSTEMKDQASLELRRINDAFSILVDPAQRFRYDQTRKNSITPKIIKTKDQPTPPTEVNQNRSTSLNKRDLTLALIGIIVAIAFFAFIIFSSSQRAIPVALATSTSTQIIPKPSKTPTKIRPTTAPTKIIPTEKLMGQLNKWNSPKSTSTGDDECTKWNLISTSLKDQSKCIRGIVKSTYWGDSETFYMVFSDVSTDLRIVVLGGYYYKDVVGKCIRVTGKIKVDSNVPYIIANEDNFWVYNAIAACY